MKSVLLTTLDIEGFGSIDTVKKALPLNDARVISPLNVRFKGAIITRILLFVIRGCLHDTGATFALERVHSGSLSWLYICLHDTTTNFMLARVTPVLVPGREFHSGTKSRNGIM